MQKLFNIYYKEYGNRRLQNLQNPIISDFPGFPRNALFHYLTNDDSLDLDVSNMFFKGYALRTQVDYASQYYLVDPTAKPKLPVPGKKQDAGPELLRPLGNPRRNTKVLAMEVKSFHSKNRLFQYKIDAAALTTNQQQLVVYSYNYLKGFYVYQDTPMTAYNKWWNLNKTVFDTIEKLSKETSREHFLFFDVPKVLPARSMLENFKARTNPAMVRVFDTPGKLFILELWKWMDPSLRSTSILAGLSTKTLAKVNLVLKVPDGRYTVLNLGYLNSWIKGQPNQTEFNSVTTQKFDIIQKLILVFLMVLASTVPGSEITDLEEPLEENPEGTGELDGGEEPNTTDDTNQTKTPVATGTSKPPEGGFFKNSKDAKSNSPDDDQDANLTAMTMDFEKTIANLDKDLAILEVINKKTLGQKGLKIEGTEITDATDTSEVDDIPIEELRQQVFQDKSVEQEVVSLLNDAAEIGRITASDYRKLVTHVQTRKKQKDPFGSGLTIEEASLIKDGELVIDQEKSKIEASPLVADTSMLSSTLQTLEYEYINKVYTKDVLNMVDNLQRSGVIVQKHNVEESHSALGSFEIHTLDIKPIDGQASSLRFKLPKIDDDGTYTVSGVRYKLRQQRIDNPIRKIGPDRVGLNSYYGKVSISRSNRKSNSSLECVFKRINAATISNNPDIKNIAPADVFDNTFAAPYVYNACANHFKSFTASGYTLQFDRTEREKMFSKEQLQSLEKNGSRVVGKTPKGEAIVVDTNDQFKVVGNNGVMELGDIFDLTKTSRVDAPVDFAEVKVFSKAVPVGAMLAYSIGFKKLVKLLGARYRVVEGRKQKALSPYEYAISFADVSYIFDRRDRSASLILGGLQEFHKQTRMYPVKEFENKDVYFNLFETKGLTSLYVREIDLVNQLFVDPITKGILADMNLPLTYHGLVLKAVDMLGTYHYPDGQDLTQQRIRGYERFPGTIYKSMVTSIRAFKNKNIAGKSRVEMSPYEVWNTIVKDPAVKMVEDINPIQNLKGSEIVTYLGEGGRAKESMNKASRAFHQNDQGVLSEATVDSGDVGITAYMAANPKLKNLRGAALYDGKIEPANLLSTSALLAPSADQDDPKRANFISIQQAHTVATVGYRQSAFRTSYEYVVGQRTSDMFCYAAKQDGKVISKTAEGILVEYKDGTRKGVALGRQFGRAEGSVYPHDIVSNLEVGKTFKKGRVIAYNTGFFEQDILDPTAVVLKNSMLAKVVLYESPQTYEDSCAISPALAQRCTMKSTKVKSFTIDFKENLLNVVKPGQKVSPKDILMIIEDEITAGTDVFDEEALEVLSNLSKSAPRAGYLGVIDQIEVFYHGDTADMSASLKSLADRSDRQKAAKNKAIGKPVITGSVNSDYRVEGVPLALNKAEVRIYITVETGTSNGDKLVFANQLKSTIGEVMDYAMRTKDGEEIEAVFGFRSIAARIVSSAAVIGTTNTLLKVVANKALELYEG